MCIYLSRWSVYTEDINVFCPEWFNLILFLITSQVYKEPDPDVCERKRVIPMEVMWLSFHGLYSVKENLLAFEEAYTEVVG